MLLSRNVKHLCTASSTNLFGACKGLLTLAISAMSAIRSRQCSAACVHVHV